MTTFFLTSARKFHAALAAARAASPAVHAFTSRTPHNPDSPDWRHYLSRDGLSGYAIHTGYLACVFSTVPGRGDDLVAAAVDHGAEECDCFGTFLASLYARHGFEVTGHEAWDEDQFEGTDRDRETIFRLAGRRPGYYFLRRPTRAEVVGSNLDDDNRLRVYVHTRGTAAGDQRWFTFEHHRYVDGRGWVTVAERQSDHQEVAIALYTTACDFYLAGVRAAGD